MFGDASVLHDEMTDENGNSVFRVSLVAISDVATNPHETKRRLADKLEHVMTELRK